MKLMNDEVLAHWCGERSLVVSQRTLSLTDSTSDYVVIEIPRSGQSQISLAGDLVSLSGFDVSAEDMIWISTWSIWNDWNIELGESIITGLRSANGSEPVPLDSASAQVFSFLERKLSVAILLQVLLFRWDAWLASSDANYLVQCSHDGLVWISCRNDSVQQRVVEALGKWKPRIRPMLAP